jgi:hypothetical protein
MEEPEKQKLSFIEDITRLYCQEELSTHQIAKLTNSSPRSIQYKLKQNGIKLRQIFSKPIRMAGEKEMGYLAGVLAGDGFTGKNFFNVQTIDEDFAKKVYSYLKTISEPTFRKNFRKDKNKFIFTAQLSRKRFVKQIRSVKFEKLSKYGMIQFINGFLDSEGSVDKNEQRISLSNTNLNLLKKISIFMKGLNIDNRIYRTRNKGTIPLYVINIFRMNAVKEFSKNFQFSILRKQKKVFYILKKIELKIGGKYARTRKRDRTKSDRRKRSHAS